MKRSFLFLIFIAITSVTTFAQAPYRVVFDLTSKDTLDQKAVLNWVTEIIKADPDAKAEVVLFGKSLDMIVKDRSRFAPRIQDLISAHPNISFKVCAVAMKNNQIDQSMLLPGITIVPDGIYEVISKQAEGWGYIKGKL